ncbi:hypothetical protein JTE90_011467 [Oedothorax gibbosus]|uniref:N-acetyltransferase domain-containing protein n=1 Tax=Oedothorax gibbosus TaxID=931172 RepID=A0AAV6VBP6_9ARAC|nr:hypothetical protein JTE90_011467 [Oedothorax gibbosus]
MRINSNIRIAGDKIVLIPYKKAHVVKYHSWMQDPHLLEVTASEPLTLEQEYEMQQSWCEDDDKCTFIIVDKETLDRTENEIDSLIGDVNLYLNDPDVTTAEIEVMIADSAHRSKGKGKEALLYMLRYGMEKLSIKTFVAKIKWGNSQSLKLFSNIGFTETAQIAIFKETEMKCTVNDQWKSTLLEKTQSYKLDVY